MKFKSLIILLVSLVCVAVDAVPQAKSVSKVKRERQAALRKVNETSGKLETNKKQTAKNLRELNSITADIGEHKRSITKLNSEMSVCDRRIRSLSDSIATSTARLQRLRGNYAKAVRKMKVHSSGFDQMMFLFSSQSLHEAYRRMRYLRQFAKWRDKQATEIRQEMAKLERQKDAVVELKSGQAKRMGELHGVKQSLERKQTQQNQVIADLRREGGQLEALLQEQNRRAQALDRELDRLIALEEQRAAERRRKAELARKERERKAAEAKKAAAAKAKSKKNKGGKSKSSQPDEEVEKKEQREAPEPITVTTHEDDDDREDIELSGSFQSNKGKLPYPISGKCRIIRPFGQQRHPELRHVMTYNGGIDIEASQGAVARAVFAGKVSAVFQQEGYNKVVMVRHGKYLTIYVNLSEIYVSTGQQVKMGQSIGKVSPDFDAAGKAVLHFEIRREKQKLNPAEWLR